jgi:hypothetical protein
MPSKFRTGAEEAAKSQMASFNRVDFFSVADGKSVVVRFLMDYDEWPSVEVHTMVPVQKKQPEGRRSWPKTIPAICRRTKLPDATPADVQATMPYFPYLYPDCYICDHIRKADGKAIGRSSRSFTLLVVREEVRGDGSPELGGETNKGKLLGYKDRMKEVQVTDATGKPTGDIEKVRDIQIVQQAYSNFFIHLEGMAGVHGTLLDRDYFIKRKGESTDTEYQIVHLDPQYVNGQNGPVIFDLRDAEFAKRYGIEITGQGRIYPEELDLDAHIERQMGDRYYGLYIDPRIPQPVEGKSDNSSDGQATATPVAKPETEGSADQMAALRDRVVGYSKGANGPAEAPAAPTEAPVVAPAASAAPPAAQTVTLPPGASLEPPVVPAAAPAPPAPAQAPVTVPDDLPVAPGQPVVVPDFG